LSPPANVYRIADGEADDDQIRYNFRECLFACRSYCDDVGVQSNCRKAVFAPGGDWERLVESAALCPHEATKCEALLIRRRMYRVRRYCLQLEYDM
jgi:hypothetical protein